MNKGKQLSTTFNEEELEKIAKICDREFLRTSAFIRQATLKYDKEIEERVVS